DRPQCGIAVGAAAAGPPVAGGSAPPPLLLRGRGCAGSLAPPNRRCRAAGVWWKAGSYGGLLSKKGPDGVQDRPAATARRASAAASGPGFLTGRRVGRSGGLG